MDKKNQNKNNVVTISKDEEILAPLLRAQVHGPERPPEHHNGGVMMVMMKDLIMMSRQTARVRVRKMDTLWIITVKLAWKNM